MAADSEGEALAAEGSGWPLERVLATVGLVLVCTVTVRAVGGLLSGLGVSSVHLDLGATSGSGLVVNQRGYRLPTYARLYYGTSWADVFSGLTLLGAAGLVALPRLVWDVPGDGRWSSPTVRLMTAIGAVAVLTGLGAAIGTVNSIWNAGHFGGPAEVVNVAAGVAALALAVLCAVLCRVALPYLGVTEPESDTEGRA